MGLIESFGDWLYWHYPSDQAFSQFFITMAATSIVVVTVTILEPYIKLWNRERKRKAKADLRQQEHTIRRLQGIVWRPRNEKEKLERNRFVAEFAPKLLKRTALVIVVVVVVVVLIRITGQYSAETTMELKESIRLSIENFDNVAKQLRQRTVEGTFNTTECDAITGAQGRMRAERECQDAMTMNKAGPNAGLVAQAYRHCMLKRGWLIDSCDCNDDDSRCILIGNSDNNCNVAKWKTNPVYGGRECPGHLPKALRRPYAEWECGVKAQLYGQEKWYEGYSEFDRLIGTVQIYKSCMFEKGWVTNECDEESEAESGCYEIFFQESNCLTDTRSWLDGTMERRPCLEEQSWIIKSRQEPANRQW